MNKGTRVYYTGDMANVDGFGTITKTYTTKWGQYVDIVLDDNRKLPGIFPRNIGTKYHGHCNPRFVTLDAYNAFRRERLADIGITEMEEAT